MYAASSVALKNSWAGWLTGYDFDYFATFTFRGVKSRDAEPYESLKKHVKKIVGPDGAFRKLRTYLAEFPRATYFAVAEAHRWRDDCHLHVLVKSNALGNNLRRYWSHGFATVYPLNDRGAAYCAKYLHKGSIVPVDFSMLDSGGKLIEYQLFAPPALVGFSERGR